MTQSPVLDRPMAKKKTEGFTSIAIDPDTLEAVKIAAAFKGMTAKEYASRILREQADRDIEEGYRQRSGSPPTRPKRKGGSE